MAVFQCKMCGANLEVTESTSIATCGYCGVQQTIPIADDDKKVNLFNRANHLRSSCDFDKAASVYENIAAEFPLESEAYWGLCLCKYGIEYVDDPLTGKKIPTCHRTSFDSIFDDENYEKALDNADSEAEKIYRSEAKEIERLQRAILEIVKNERPYDIFICYKETDPQGERTKDSVLAQNIYSQFTEKGYNVFFARITLEGYLGKDYEPYIFAALNSAKVMLAVGTSSDNFNAVWVKNEWSRFLSLMKNDIQKTIIPCYCDMDAYELPKEFKNIQGQDMSKVGFLQDLVRGVEKIIPLSAAAAGFLNQSDMPVTADSLLERVFSDFLIYKHWEQADQACEKVLNSDLKNTKAYIGKLMAYLKVCREEELGSCSEDYETNENYIKAYRYADKETKEKLEGYLRSTKQHVSDLGDEANYNKAMTAFNEGEYEKAEQLFKSTHQNYDVGDFLDKCQEGKLRTAELTDRCRAAFKSHDLSSGGPYSQKAEECLSFRSSMKSKYRGFDQQIPEPREIKFALIWLIPIAISVIGLGVIISQNPGLSGFTDIIALLLPLAALLVAWIGNGRMRLLDSKVYYGAGIILSIIFDAGLFSGFDFITQQILSSKVKNNAAAPSSTDLEELARVQTSVIFIAIGGFIALIAALVIFLHARKLARIKGYHKAEKTLENLYYEKDESLDEAIGVIMRDFEDLPRQAVERCVGAAKESYMS
ncbi:MAG: toll/interleukin-1 receptor domain-containing protein [Firmicutes bacterium]|nr:toll/interleukin-1 receptor domain-containing protein [[Eubacterium] siraeum]MCM1487148.1 toll/interleukin-1 receptor domain-containing protein [Bacillota bacterium]